MSHPPRRSPLNHRLTAAPAPPEGVPYPIISTRRKYTYGRDKKVLTGGKTPAGQNLFFYAYAALSGFLLRRRADTASTHSRIATSPNTTPAMSRSTSRTSPERPGTKS